MDQCVYVSTTIRPVTQVALVAVNKAFMYEIDLPSALAAGSDSRRLPPNIVIKKPSAITCVYEKLYFCILIKLPVFPPSPGLY